MKLKNLVKKLFEANPNADQEVFIELWEDTDNGSGYKSLKIPIKDVEWDSDYGLFLDNPKPVCSVEDLILRGRVDKAFFHRWEKRKYSPANVEGEIEGYFPIKKKVKLTLPRRKKGLGSDIK